VVASCNMVIQSMSTCICRWAVPSETACWCLHWHLWNGLSTVKV